MDSVKPWLHTSSHQKVRVEEGCLYSSVCCYNNLSHIPKVTDGFELPLAIERSSTYSQELEARASSHTVGSFYTFANPWRSFAFDILCPSSCELGASSHEPFICATLDGDIVPLVSLRASTSVRANPLGNGLTVLIAPGWWSSAMSFTLTELRVSGRLVDSPLIPATVAVLSAANTLSVEGQLLAASGVNDAAGVIAAIIGGCSTEELDEKVGRNLFLSACCNSAFKFVTVRCSRALL